MIRSLCADGHEMEAQVLPCADRGGAQPLGNGSDTACGPDVFLAGLAEACRAFGLPVVSGNVSFYNESAGRSSLHTKILPQRFRLGVCGFSGAGFRA